MYTYVHQNPWTHFDPEGLLDIEINGKTVPWTPVNQAKAFIQNAKDFFGGAGERLSDKGAALKRGATTSPLTTVPQLARSIVNSASNFYNDPIHATAISPDAFTPRGLGRTSVDFAQALVTQELGGAAFSKSKVPEVAPGGTSARETSTVGRWMSQDEFNKTVSTSTVQESRTGTTHVTSPADPSVYKPTAPPGSVHAQFDVPTSSIMPTSAGGVAKIIGPNSMEGKLAASKGKPVPQMPQASNIKITDNKPLVKPPQPQQQSH
jgi:hypothetical protein